MDGAGIMILRWPQRLSWRFRSRWDRIPSVELRALPGASTASSGGGWILPRSCSN